MPNGVPRLGPPAEIIALKDQPFVLLIYSLREMRIVPTDGRSHNLINVAAETWNGDPVGRWEGDTLVIESVGFTDASWLAKSGFIHGFNMKVTETLTRDRNNNLTWSATVEDPEYLEKPWKRTISTSKAKAAQMTLVTNALYTPGAIGNVTKRTGDNGQGLEPDEGRPSRPVLRGLVSGNTHRLPGGEHHGFLFFQTLLVNFQNRRSHFVL